MNAKGFTVSLSLGMLSKMLLNSRHQERTGQRTKLKYWGRRIQDTVEVKYADKIHSLWRCIHGKGRRGALLSGQSEMREIPSDEKTPRSDWDTGASPKRGGPVGRPS